MKKAFNIELDIAWDYGLERSIQEFLSIVGLRIISVTRVGPAGGNPNVILQVDTEEQIGYVYKIYSNPEASPIFITGLPPKGDDQNYLDFKDLHVSESDYVE